MTHVVAAVADASPGPLPHHEQVHLCSSRTGTAQTLSAAIGRLPDLGVPVKGSEGWILYTSDLVMIHLILFLIQLSYFSALVSG